MKTRQSIRHPLLFAAALALLALPLRAEEGAGGHYQPGILASMIDFPPEKPGFALDIQFLNYEGDSNPGAASTFAGLLPNGVVADGHLTLFAGTYTFENRVLGAHYTVAAAIPFAYQEVAAVLGGLRVLQSEYGLSDVILVPVMLQWRREHWKYGFIGAVYAPTGDYEAGRLANVGKNFWTFEPTLAASYLSPKHLIELTTFAGVDFNTENEDTDYQSGSQAHIEATLVKNFDGGRGTLYGIGVSGFHYQQIEGDSGSGAVLGDFKGMTTGVGPLLRYLQKSRGQTSFIEIKWLPELDTENRLEGDYVWFKFGSNF